MNTDHIFHGLAGVALSYLALTSCATDRQVIAQAESTHDELKPAVIEDSQLSGYMDAIGDRIVGAAKALDQEDFGPKSHREEKNDWMFTKEQFHLVNSQTLNAFTTGGEHMYIYGELFRQCRSEDELAAVMAHEYGHVYARHVHKGINRQMVAVGGAALAGAGGYAAGGKEHGKEYGTAALGLGLVAGQFLNMGYTRDDEAEADKLGFAFYSRAGWDPDHFGDFFQQLIDKGLDTTPEVMSDHPSLKSRVDAARERAGKLPPQAESWRRPPIADPSRFAALKQRAAQLSKSTPSDKELAKAQTLLSAIPSCVLPVDQPDQKQAQHELELALQEQQARGAPRRK